MKYLSPALIWGLPGGRRGSISGDEDGIFLIVSNFLRSGYFHYLPTPWLAERQKEQQSTTGNTDRKRLSRENSNFPEHLIERENVTTNNLNLTFSRIGKDAIRFKLIYSVFLCSSKSAMSESVDQQEKACDGSAEIEKDSR